MAGVERLNINITGISAHGGRPQHGISAAAIEARALHCLGEDGWFGEVKKGEQYGTANLGVLKGGKGSNQVMPELYCLAEARSLDISFRSEIIRQWKRAFSESVEYFNGKSPLKEKAAVEFSPGPVYDPFTMEKDSSVMKTVDSAIKACGLKPYYSDDMGGQDSNNIVAAGIPAVGVGMGCARCHQPDEYVDIGQFEKCCELARVLVERKWDFKKS